MSDETLTLADASRALRAGQITSVELTEGALRRIRRTNPAVNAWVTVLDEAAVSAAARADDEIKHGFHRGPLHGIPLGVKSNIDLHGVRTTAGSRVLPDHPAEHDAEVVRALRNAGAVLLGTLNMHEFGQGVTSENPHFGSVRNPWDLRRNAGGSSGGSAAAVAAQTCFGALGTDTGGSIRLPAALAGVTGLRPTFQRVSSRGIVPLAWSLDTCGPMARTAEDVSLMLAAVARVPYSHWESERPFDLSSVRIGVVDLTEDDWLEDDVRRVIATALDDLEESGVEVKRIAFPDLRVAHSVLMIVNFAEPPALHSRWFPGRRSDYGADVRATLMAGDTVAAWQYVQARRATVPLRADLLSALQGVDALAFPTAPFRAPLLSSVLAEPGEQAPDAASLIDGAVKFNALASVTGMPAVSVPCGFTTDGLPVGLQLLARPWEERRLLRVAHAYQLNVPWHRRTPPEMSSDPLNR